MRWALCGAHTASHRADAEQAGKVTVRAAGGASGAVDRMFTLNVIQNNCREGVGQRTWARTARSALRVGVVSRHTSIGVVAVDPLFGVRQRA